VVNLTWYPGVQECGGVGCEDTGWLLTWNLQRKAGIDELILRLLSKPAGRH